MDAAWTRHGKAWKGMERHGFGMDLAWKRHGCGTDWHRSMPQRVCWHICPNPPRNPGVAHVVFHAARPCRAWPARSDPCPRKPAFPCSVSRLCIRARCPCPLSVPAVRARCPCPVCVLGVRAPCPCLVSAPPVRARCPCLLSVPAVRSLSPCLVSVPAARSRCPCPRPVLGVRAALELPTWTSEDLHDVLHAVGFMSSAGRYGRKRMLIINIIIIIIINIVIHHSVARKLPVVFMNYCTHRASLAWRGAAAEDICCLLILL